MNYVSKLRPELVDDVAEAFHWYEQRADFRRVLLRRFPYALYFRIEDNVIVFVLLFPCARNPRLLRKQLRGRQE